MTRSGRQRSSCARYMCEFVQDFEGLFDMEVVDAAFEDR
jgi:hypothetical protein